MIVQRSPEWFQQRKGKITGSAAGAILGLSPFSKPADVMRRMIRDHYNAETEFLSNIATSYGTKFEDYAVADFEMETGLSVEETGFHISDKYDWLGASPDGLIGDDAVSEVKCPYGKRDSDDFKSILEQPHYYAQTQLEMLCTNRTICHFYQWSVKGSKIETVELSQAWLDENIPKLKAFYDKYLIELKTPDKHLSPLVKTRESSALANEYSKLKAVEKQTKKRLDEIKKEFIAIADNKKSNISGVLVYPIERKGTVQYKDIPELKDVDLEQYRGKATNTWGVR